MASETENFDRSPSSRTYRMGEANAWPTLSACVKNQKKFVVFVFNALRLFPMKLHTFVYARRVNIVLAFSG